MKLNLFIEIHLRLNLLFRSIPLKNSPTKLPTSVGNANLWRLTSKSYFFLLCNQEKKGKKSLADRMGEMRMAHEYWKDKSETHIKVCVYNWKEKRFKDRPEMHWTVQRSGVQCAWRPTPPYTSSYTVPFWWCSLPIFPFRIWLEFHHQTTTKFTSRPHTVRASADVVHGIE